MTGKAWRLVKPKREKRRSPQEIEQWLSREYPEHHMSAETVYSYIHFRMKGELKKLVLSELRQEGKKRRRPGEKGGKIPETALIDRRPDEAAGRAVPGRWEGDLIIGARHRSALSGGAGLSR